MASIFLYHVIGDLTVGKPEIVEFYETETVKSAISILGESAEGSIPVWRRPQACASAESVEMRQQRFLGILNSFDVVAFLARKDCLSDQEKALSCPVSEVVFADNSLLREVDPGTRLLDAMEIMKQGVRRLLVPKSGVWRGTSKHFSILLNGRWLRSLETYNDGGGGRTAAIIDRPSSNLSIPKPLNQMAFISNHKKFCCLSREDVLRFLIGCLGALAPIPLTSIHSLGSINHNYRSIDASAPAMDVVRDRPQDPCAVAVVERVAGGSEGRIIGEISSSKLWKSDHITAAWAVANLSARQFVMGEEEVEAGPLPQEISANPGGMGFGNGGRPVRAKRFSSRSIGFFGNLAGGGLGPGWGAYRGRSEPLMCRSGATLAAVMAQMLSHRATHVWVTEPEKDDVVVGVVGYADILTAVMCHSTQPQLPPSSVTIHKADPMAEEASHVAI